MSVASEGVDMEINFTTLGEVVFTFRKLDGALLGSCVLSPEDIDEIHAKSLMARPQTGSA